MIEELQVTSNVLTARDESYKKAVDSLALYKFEMFGYWASAWVKYNQLLPPKMKAANPFKELIHHAREMRARDCLNGNQIESNQEKL